MKLLIAVLIIAAFLQTSILTWDLVLVLLICRSYLRVDKTNLVLGFWFGIMVSFLGLGSLGLQAVIYLILIQITQVLSRFPLAGNALLIIPISLVALSLNHIALALFTHQTLQLIPTVIGESLLSLPVLYLLRVWEERFIVRKGIKLRV